MDIRSNSRLLRALALFAATWCALGLPASPSARAAELAPARPGINAADALTAEQLARQIDDALAAGWRVAKISPAAPADDAEFLRRAYLDLVGKIPSVAEARAFLAGSDPEKRAKLVEDLIHRGAHATHMANTWREVMLSGAAGGIEARAFAPQFDTWLRLRLAANTPYDQLVNELLTATATTATQRGRATANSGPSPLAFYIANEGKPEQLAATTSRVFLGVQVQCAQCHDHPFAKWSRQQFWSFTAFFTGLGGDVEGNPLPIAGDTDRQQIKIPDTEMTVSAAFLDGSQPNWQSGQSKRAALASWITEPNNPYFGRAAVNRLWEHFLGRGFVAPVDNLDPSNPPSHPELFDLVTRQFVLHRYDVNYLIRAITATKAYQLSSRTPAKSAGSENTTAASDDELALFARIPLRRMTADQLLDSIVAATGFREPLMPRDQVVFGATSIRAEFQQRFADQSAARTDGETSILQALSMMNGKLTGSVTDLQSSETLMAIAEAPFLDDAGRIETLFLATLSRFPTADEVKELTALLGPDPKQRASKAALADVFWALLNSAEFVLVH